jgi:zinc D-Ala-D-Ala carboxypeptidase
MLRNLNAKIIGAPNFKYGEFTKSSTAMRHGIKNEPTEDQWRCIELVASKILQPIRENFGPIRITSGFRTVELCLKVGSSITSNHAQGQAVDFEPLRDNVSLLQILTFIHDNLDYRELIAEYFPGGWVHCAYRKGGNSKILKLKDDNHSYVGVDISLIKKIYS